MHHEDQKRHGKLQMQIIYNPGVSFGDNIRFNIKPVVHGMADKQKARDLKRKKAEKRC